jgi:DNA-binding NarL/FixJ family response regulator
VSYGNGHRQRTSGVFAGLTPRELETLSLMAEGLSNRSIAERMFVTEHAIEKHVTNVLWKVTGTFWEHRPTYDRRVLAVVAYLKHALVMPDDDRPAWARKDEAA